MLIRIAAFVFASLTIVAVGTAIAGAYYLWQLNEELPEYDQLSNYQPPVTTRVHAGDGSLIAEYARERRLFVPITSIPDAVKAAFLSAEDKNFYSHPV